MILKSALDLSQSIKEHRQDMYKLAENKGMSDPEVIQISQQLDGQIIKLQKIMCELDSYRQEHLLIRVANMGKPNHIAYDSLNE